MKQLLLIAFLLTSVATLTACPPKNDNLCANPGNVTVNGPNCVAYNPVQYPTNNCYIPGQGYVSCNGSNYTQYSQPFGCPVGYVPVPSGVAGSNGYQCVNYVIFQNVYPQSCWSGGASGGGGLGPLQQCDAYNYYSCGANTGLHCVATNGRWGVCR